MTKTFNLIIVAVALITAGCASNSGEYPSARTPSTSPTSTNKALKCNANEVLICETRSPHRVSDGRYGRKNNKGKNLFIELFISNYLCGSKGINFKNLKKIKLN